jgi:hypothetical protein
MVYKLGQEVSENNIILRYLINLLKKYFSNIFTYFFERNTVGEAPTVFFNNKNPNLRPWGLEPVFYILFKWQYFLCMREHMCHLQGHVDLYLEKLPFVQSASESIPAARVRITSASTRQALRGSCGE